MNVLTRAQGAGTCPVATRLVLIVQHTAESRLRIVGLLKLLTMAGKASIHSLPTEIKRRIAELCQLQDETSRDVFAHLRYRLADNAYASDEAETDLSKRGPFAEHRYGPKSLLSLSCVSKEWRDIALKILLRVNLILSRAQGIFQEISL
jgi:hypothetical protein